MLDHARFNCAGLMRGRQSAVGWYVWNEVSLTNIDWIVDTMISPGRTYHKLSEEGKAYLEATRASHSRCIVGTPIGEYRLEDQLTSFADGKIIDFSPLELKPIGSGSFGEVYKCRLKSSGLVVAVKKLKDKHSGKKREGGPNNSERELRQQFGKASLHLPISPSTLVYKAPELLDTSTDVRSETLVYKAPELLNTSTDGVHAKLDRSVL